MPQEEVRRPLGKLFPRQLFSPSRLHVNALLLCFCSTFPGRSRCLDAFVVALGQARGGGKKRWYASTLELQLASLELCRVCRSCPTLDVRVSVGTVHSLWVAREFLAGPDTGGSKRIRSSSRVPVVRALRLTWVLPMKDLVQSAAVELWRWAECLQLGRYLPTSSTESVPWPTGLKELVLDCILGGPIEKMSWPPSLECLVFGSGFDQPIAGVVWPMSLQQVSFGNWFNQTISGISWPDSLRQLSFGSWFNHPIEGVVWPASLQQLSFGGEFNHPIVGVVWPVSLQQLSFGRKFNQPIADVVWPASLQQLSFGYDFKQPIAGVLWPASTQSVTQCGKIIFCRAAREG